MKTEDKNKILQAYFEKVISKDEIEFLLEVGIICPPIPWILNDLEEKRKSEKKRILIE